MQHKPSCCKPCRHSQSDRSSRSLWLASTCRTSDIHLCRINRVFLGYMSICSFELLGEFARPRLQDPDSLRLGDCCFWIKDESDQCQYMGPKICFAGRLVRIEPRGDGSSSSTGLVSWPFGAMASHLSGALTVCGTMAVE